MWEYKISTSSRFSIFWKVSWFSYFLSVDVNTSELSVQHCQLLSVVWHYLHIAVRFSLLRPQLRPEYWQRGRDEFLFRRARLCSPVWRCCTWPATPVCEVPGDFRTLEPPGVLRILRRQTSSTHVQTVHWQPAPEGAEGGEQGGLPHLPEEAGPGRGGDVAALLPPVSLRLSDGVAQQGRQLSALQEESPHWRPWLGGDEEAEGEGGQTSGGPGDVTQLHVWIEPLLHVNNNSQHLIWNIPNSLETWCWLSLTLIMVVKISFSLEWNGVRFYFNSPLGLQAVRWEHYE